MQSYFQAHPKEGRVNHQTQEIEMREVLYLRLEEERAEQVVKANKIKRQYRRVLLRRRMVRDMRNVFLGIRVLRIGVVGLKRSKRMGLGECKKVMAVGRAYEWVGRQIEKRVMLVWLGMKKNILAHRLDGCTRDKKLITVIRR